MVRKETWSSRQAKKTAHARGIAHNIISDQLNDLYSHADGKRYDSKRAYYAAVKRAGCEIVGGMRPESYVAPKKRPTKTEIVGDIKRAMQEISWG